MASTTAKKKKSLIGKITLVFSSKKKHNQLNSETTVRPGNAGKALLPEKKILSLGRTGSRK